MNGCPRVSEVRQAVSDAARVALEPEGWRVSPFVPGSAATSDPREPREAAHQCFAVAATVTEPWSGDRQRPRSRAVVAETALVITWTWALPVDDQVAGYDAALDGEERLVAALLGIDDAAVPFPARLVRARRRHAAGWVLGEIEIVVQHPLNLALREAT